MSVLYSTTHTQIHPFPDKLSRYLCLTLTMDPDHHHSVNHDIHHNSHPTSLTVYIPQVEDQYLYPLQSKQIQKSKQLIEDLELKMEVPDDIIIPPDMVFNNDLKLYDDKLGRKIIYCRFGSSLIFFCASAFMTFYINSVFHTRTALIGPLIMDIISLFICMDHLKAILFPRPNIKIKISDQNEITTPCLYKSMMLIEQLQLSPCKFEESDIFLILTISNCRFHIELSTAPNLDTSIVMCGLKKDKRLVQNFSIWWMNTIFLNKTSSPTVASHQVRLFKSLDKINADGLIYNGTSVNQKIYNSNFFNCILPY